MRKIASLLLGLLFSVPAHANDLQCMGRFPGGWNAVLVEGSPVQADFCVSDITLGSFPSQVYHLVSGPNRSRSQVTCRWTWKGDAFGNILPKDEVPESVVCTLFGNSF